MASMHLSADTRQTQTLSPRLQRAVQLLQLSSLDFAAMVRSKLDENPFLEEEEGDEETPAPEEPVETFRESEVSSDPSDDRDSWMADRHPGGQQMDEEGASAMDLAACDTRLAAHLHTQLNVMTLSHRDLCLARAVVESLEEDGYLHTPLEELVELVPLSPAPQLDEFMVALRLVQSLDPPGVGARNVGECLALQCPSIEDPELRELAQRIVESHLDALAARDLGRLSRVLGQPPARVEQAITAIRHLDPRPGWAVGPSRVDYIVPDVIVRRVRGNWHVQLNPAVVPRVRINKVYEELFQRHRRSEHSQMVDHLHDARWTLRNVEQRFATILEVAQAIVRKQQLFLEFGPIAMKPLILREVAEEIGMHESTVSRVTNNKYISTPLGVFELKYFFSRAMVSDSKQPCSATAIRELIRDLIAAESPTNPLSDGEIARQLAMQGLRVVRRTVTKYRQQLHIEPIDKRRRHL